MKHIYKFSEFELDADERTLTRNGVRIPLTPRAFDLLLVLVGSNGRLLTKEQLLERVWADAVVEEGNLNRTISAVRKALGDAKSEKRLIETVPKAGYRFVGEVVSIESNGRNAGRLLSAAVDGHRYRLPQWILAAAVFMVIFGVLAGAYLFVPRVPAGSVPGLPAVVRLTNSPFDEDQAGFTRSGKIRFARFLGNHRVESVLMNDDGTEQTRLGSGIKGFRAGLWSPDEKKVVFTKEFEKPTSLYLANGDGTGEIPLSFEAGSIDWAPDSSGFVFNGLSPGDRSNSEIFIYSVAANTVTNISNSKAFEANASFSPDGTQVLFNSDRDGNAEIYLMNADGSDVRRLTDHPAREAFQVFSPDGTQIAFNSNREGENIGIYLLDINGSGEPVRISDRAYNAEIRAGCWSPDGTKIVFTSDKDGEKYNVYTLNADLRQPEFVYAADDGDVRQPALSPDGGTLAVSVRLSDQTGELRLINMRSGSSTRRIATSENGGLLPSWSPDGGSIAFNCKVNGNSDICTVEISTGEISNITHDPSRDSSAAWSPDGAEIVFASDRDGGSESFSLFRMSAAGENQRRVTNKYGYEMEPAWSLDGRSIVFSGDRVDGTNLGLDIISIDADDPSRETLLARRRSHDTSAAISPDGNRIAFVGEGDGNTELYLMNSDGTGLVRLTRNAAQDISPRFSSDGRWLLFSSNRSGRYAIYRIAV